MNLEKAIEILSLSSNGTTPVTLADLQDAMKLGIEAMKCVKEIRHHPFPEEVLLLPGETED